jgi:hypothetical protein
LRRVQKSYGDASGKIRAGKKMVWQKPPEMAERGLNTPHTQKKRECKNAKHYNTGPVLENYKKIETEVAKKIKYAKKKFEKDLTYSDAKNSKKFSKYIKSKTKIRTQIGPLKNTKNVVTTNNLEMANILNEFFASVFTAEDVDNMPQKVRETNVEISEVEFTRGKLLQKMPNLKTDTAPGPDNIHPRILKELRFELADPLCKLLTKSMNTGKVPLDWKVAVVTPIYKKGAKADPGNYRPVSLTSVPCKIMESIIKDTMMAHLEQENLIRDSQHGFIPGRSCAMNLLTFQEEITKCLDDGVPVDVFYLDFAKAFDKVPHGWLLVKLESKEITGNLKRWVKEWLANRTQRVLVDGAIEAKFLKT